MLLEIDEWKFDIDFAATMEYSAGEAREHCTCAYCRNFYAAVDDTYPELRPFLGQFGLDIEAPDELMPFAATNVSVLYAVSGRIVTRGSGPIMAGDIRVFPEEWEISMVNTDCPDPIFILDAGPFDLPWLLDEAIDDVESPANEPGFSERMKNRFLRRKNDDIIPS